MKINKNHENFNEINENHPGKCGNKGHPSLWIGTRHVKNSKHPSNSVLPGFVSLFPRQLPLVLFLAFDMLLDDFSTSSCTDNGNDGNDGSQ